MEYPRDSYPIEQLSAEAIDAPAGVEATPHTKRDWLETGHAEAGVNCSGCHQPADEEGTLTAWQDKPGIEGCQSCHGPEIKRFLLGKHGMRLAAGLPPMTPALARLPMHEAVGHEAITCSSCHQAPNSKMIRSACQSCHGLEFSINALADRDLIDRNFQGASSIHVPSVDMAHAENERYLRERASKKKQRFVN